jgi:hypothetical protein
LPARLFQEDAMTDIAEGIDQRDIDRLILGTTARHFDLKSEVDHLATAIIIEGRSEKAFAENDIEKAEELHNEAGFELDSIEDERGTL